MKRKLFTLVFLSLAGWLFSQDIDVPREQKSLVTKLTATWCPICGDAAWDIYENLVRDAEGKAVVLAAHYSGSSELYSQTAVELINAYHGRPSGQPIFYFNQDKVSSNVENQVLGKVNDAYAAGPMAQTGIVLEYDLTNKELVARTRTQFFQSASGEYYLSVLLVEREVSADQAGRSANALHKRVLRKSVTTETLGRLLASGTIPKDASFELTARTPVASSTEAAKYQVATILWRKTDEGREFVNANFNGQISEFTTPTFAVEASPVDLRIQPNPVSDQSIVTIRSDVDLGAFQVNLYAATGQLLRAWRQDEAAGKEFALTLSRRDLPQAGVYFLQLRTERGVITRKLIAE